VQHAAPSLVGAKGLLDQLRRELLGRYLTLGRRKSTVQYLSLYQIVL